MPYCVLVLVWLFNRLIKSLRGLQRTSDITKVRKRLGVTRAPLGSLSESVAILDPEPLTQIAVELAHRLPAVRQGRFEPDSGQCRSRDAITEIYHLRYRVRRCAESGRHFSA